MTAVLVAEAVRWHHLGDPRLVTVVTRLANHPRPAVSAAVIDALADGLAVAWERGWQPADVHRVVRHHRSAEAARVTRVAMARQARSWIADARRWAPGWVAQLERIGALPGTEPDVLWPPAPGPLDLRRLAEAVGAVATVTALEEVAVLGPPPSRWGRGPVDAGGLPPGVLAKVRALLAKAESTPYEAEAEAFWAKAHELMVRHRIDRELLAAADRACGPVELRRIGVEPPHVRPKAALVGAVARAMGCRAVWCPDLWCCTVFGHPADLEATETMHASLARQADAALDREGARPDGRRRRTTGFRRSFLTAFAHRVGQRLTELTRAEVDRRDDGRLLPALAASSERIDAHVHETFGPLGTFALPVSDLTGYLAGRAAAETADLAPGPALTGRRDV